MDYKERFIELLDEMYKDKRAGLIPSIMAEGVKMCKAYSEGDGFLDYWVINAFYAK